jgi:hypothetical protein
MPEGTSVATILNQQKRKSVTSRGCEKNPKYMDKLIACYNEH